ncbi:MAG TPA: ATP-binding protein, partial [Gammaproteobacteria bacterium]|nr:ATP-binding protein [Gammaproteobacteria bacterium]
GVDLVKEIIAYAREENVTLIMVWKHITSRWLSIWTRHLADEILRNSQEINVYIITGSLTEQDTKRDVQLILRNLPLSYVYVAAIVASVVTTIICFLLYKYVKAHNLSLIYLASVILVSLLGRIGPSLLSAVLSVFAYTWFFYPGIFNKSITNFEFLSILILMIVLVQVISNLTFISRNQAAAARASERKATALNRLSQQLASARGVHKLLEIGASYIAELFNSDVMVLMPANQQLTISYSVGGERELDAKDLAVAQWVFDLGQVAGMGTDTLSQADAIYVPLLASQTTVGVLRIRPKHPEQLFTPEQMNFLGTCANQLALTMEVDLLQEQRKKVEIDKEVDHTRNVLLQSVSQDLRAPLATIMLTAGTQMQMAHGLSSERVRALGRAIYTQTEQLSRLVNNLLQITYLESNAVKLKKEPASLTVLVQRVIHSSRDKLGSTPVYIEIPSEIPLIPFDKVLMEGVFLNLLDNAIKFAPKEQTITISAKLSDDKVIVSVEDRGPGISGDEVSRLFEKFYRGRMLTSKRGLGLGLAICRMIIEAHGGIIWAENRDGGGSAFRFTLPLNG